MTRQFIPAAIALMVVLSAGGTHSVQAESNDKKEKTGLVYELRTYTTAEGRLPALHKRFRDHTIDLFAKHGIKNVIYWVPEDQENTLVYLIAHKSIEARDASFKAFRQDPQWQKVYKESRKDGPIVTNVEKQYLIPTDYSPDPFAAAPEGWIYELRTYTTNEGKLPNLHARFRDHTMKLFKKHGMHNVMYWTPADKKNTLVYVIAHKNRAAADASWKAFSQDPEWQRVARESQKDGRILVRAGVRRQYLTTTDYSPHKQRDGAK